MTMRPKVGTWFAMDVSGHWWAFKNKPWIGQQHWSTDSVMSFVDKNLFDLPICSNWNESLFQVTEEESPCEAK